QRVPAQRAWSEGAPFKLSSQPRRSDEVGAGTARAGESRRTYYDIPVLKEPVWVWAVPTYFYSGGAAGAAAVLGAAAQIADRDGLHDLISWSRRIAAGGALVGTALLVYDLGRPSRFLHMLRVFRPT